MERSDLKELRKIIKNETAPDWVYGVYVDAENQVSFETVMRLADMEDAEKFRHLNLFNRVLSTRIGLESFPVKLKEQQLPLLQLRKAGAEELEVFEEFRDHLLTHYRHTDPYYATLVRIAYDVPARAEDGRRLEDGDRVYEALLLAICPASLSKPVLGYDVDHVGELDRRWQIGNPACGFLYPSFDDRGEDRNEVMIYSKTPDREEYLNGLFGVTEKESPVGVKAQKGIFSTLLGQMDPTLKEAVAFSESIVEHAAMQEEPELRREDLKKLIGESGTDTEMFDEIYEDTVGETPIAIAAVAESSVSVCTDAVTIRVSADKAQLIETRRINGRDYILIPADGTVTVNGSAVRAFAEPDSAPESEEEE